MDPNAGWTNELSRTKMQETKAPENMTMTGDMKDKFSMAINTSEEYSRNDSKKSQSNTLLQSFLTIRRFVIQMGHIIDP